MGQVSSEYWDKLNPNEPEQKNIDKKMGGCFTVIVICAVVGIMISNAMTKGKLESNKQYELYKDAVDSLHNNFTDTVEINTR